MVRMTELFNVNHFIVSQANPLIAPFVVQHCGKQAESMWVKLRHMLGAELQHRIWQASGCRPRGEKERAWLSPDR